MKKNQFLVMSALIISLGALAAYSPSASAFTLAAEQKLFSVQNEDIAIRVTQPTKTLKHIFPVEYGKENLALIGAQVTVCFPDQYELVGQPQCHWDGISERSRYAYTITYKLKTSTTSPQLIQTRQINIANFTATHVEKSGTPPTTTRMTITPSDGYVAFEALPMKEIRAGADPKLLMLTSNTK